MKLHQATHQDFEKVKNAYIDIINNMPVGFMVSTQPMKLSNPILKNRPCIFWNMMQRWLLSWR